MNVPLPSFDHIISMSDTIGTFEHADHVTPRRSHGYCVDDMARLLVVIVRQPDPDRALLDLGRTTFRFLADAQGVSGTVRNRCTARGRWQGKRGVEDCWGRSVWAFGSAVRRAPERWMRESALPRFYRGIEQRSPWPRSMAYAALGAAEVLAVQPADRQARALLADAVDAIGPVGTTSDWPWPEPRLSYANAVVPEALIAAGALLERPGVLADGVALLRWLLDRETTASHLSPTPAGGAGPGDLGTRFDQQPIEAAAMADACGHAALVTGKATWLDGIDLAVRWFAGDNDASTVMWDPETGGGFDGLHARGANRNEGAESTIALISTLQHARLLDPATG